MLWVRISIRARCITLCDKVCHWLAAGQWYFSSPPVSSTYKTDHHDITEIFLKVALNTHNSFPNIANHNRNHINTWTFFDVVISTISARYRRKTCMGCTMCIVEWYGHTGKLYITWWQTFLQCICCHRIVWRTHTTSVDDFIIMTWVICKVRMVKKTYTFFCILFRFLCLFDGI